MKLRTLALIATTATAGLVGCSHDEPAKDPSTTSSNATATSPTTTTETYGANGTNGAAATDTDPPKTGKMADATSTTATTNAGSTGTAPPATPPPASPPPSNPPPTTQGSATHPPDNTGVNDRDRGNTATPMTQGNSASEVRITAAIRRSVMSDSSLGFNAKNVKIITNGTRVVLRGPVANEHERAAIEAWAKQAAGVTAVDNLLEVKQ